MTAMPNPASSRPEGAASTTLGNTGGAATAGTGKELLRVEDLKVTRSFYLATHRERSRSPLAEAFRIFLEAEVA